MSIESFPNKTPSDKLLEKEMPWTDKDVAVGKQFFEAYDTFAGSFNQKKNNVANAIGFKDGYYSMPSGVRSYISHIAGEANKRKKEAEREAKAGHTQELIDDWNNQIKTNPEFAHAALHPEDDERLIEQLSKSTE